MEDGGEWTVASLLKAAAEFSARVASCPQVTRALLTNYDNNRSFLEWANAKAIEIP